jgi:APA family basic amino acid/polyamine antiporter
MKQHKLGLFTATSVVIANMVGTGVFTSLGFQAAGLQSGSSIMLLWLLGGILALTGAFCYAETGSAIPQSGGEYMYLSKLIHPAAGFAAGWVSITVGFAAPVAAASMAFGKYLANLLPNINETLAAETILLVLTIIQSLSLRLGGKVQDVTTSVKLMVMAAFIIAGLMLPERGNFNFSLSDTFMNDVASSSFTTSFFFVTLAYSGWNAAAYFASDLENPKSQLPKALISGTIIVALLYCCINYVFMRSTTASEMLGREGPVVEIAAVSASHIFGPAFGALMGGVIALLLISTINAMILAGPRVTMAMGQDHRVFRFFAKTSENNVPARAILTQSLISTFFILTATFSEVIIYISFTLNLFTFLTVLAGFIYRLKGRLSPESFLAPFFPFTHLIFLGISGWLLFYGFGANPNESLLGLLTACAGLLVWLLSSKTK